jgi:DNA-binding transcriptional MerR regulator
MKKIAPLDISRAPDELLLRISDAAAVAGVSERALRYYQQLGLIVPSGATPGGMRRYSKSDVARVVRIKELQSLLALNLDEIAVVLRNEDRMAEIRVAYHQDDAESTNRRALLEECLVLQEELRATVHAKRAALNDFMNDLDARLGRIKELLASGDDSPTGVRSAKAKIASS